MTNRHFWVAFPFLKGLEDVEARSIFNAIGQAFFDESMPSQGLHRFQLRCGVLRLGAVVLPPFPDPSKTR
jgi:hypothetical protein